MEEAVAMPRCFVPPLVTVAREPSDARVAVATTAPLVERLLVASLRMPSRHTRGVQFPRTRVMGPLGDTSAPLGHGVPREAVTIRRQLPPTPFRPYGYRRDAIRTAAYGLSGKPRHQRAT